MREADKSRGAGLLVLIPDMETTKICNFPRSDIFSHTFIMCHHFGDMAFKSATDERQREDRREVGRGNEKTGKEMRDRTAEMRKRWQQCDGETISQRHKVAVLNVPFTKHVVTSITHKLELRLTRFIKTVVI